MSEPSIEEFDREAERLFDCAHNNMGWNPISDSLYGAYEGGKKAAAAEIASLRAQLAEAKTNFDELEKLSRGRSEELGDELTALLADNERLRDALKPFAEIAGLIRPSRRDDQTLLGYDGRELTTGEFRRARAALAQKDDEG